MALAAASFIHVTAAIITITVVLVDVVIVTTAIHRLVILRLIAQIYEKLYAYTCSVANSA